VSALFVQMWKLGEEEKELYSRSVAPMHVYKRKKYGIGITNLSFYMQRVGCRCFWDSNTDRVATETFINVRLTGQCTPSSS